jgi:steroid 5-alpha reductase family enzyme
LVQFLTSKKLANPSPFLKFFLVFTAFWIFITLLPTLMLNNENLGDRPLGMQDYIGWSLWIIGMAFEGIADLQKSMFRNDPKNEGKFITSGLWSISRHPNYFGEILLWFGLYIAASSVFKKWQYLAVMSPMAVLWLITKYSGIPILEGYGQEKWGKLAQYQNYVANTPVLVPFWK